MNPLSILVLAGGPSAEREVSLMGGEQVAAALRSLGHQVRQSDVGPNDLSALDAGGFDVVFPVLHGAWGEDGGLQRELEARGLAYVGSGPEASARAMSKSASKAAFASEGLPTPAWQVLDGWPEASADRLAAALPLVVKPVEQGSSVDLAIARDAVALRRAVEDVAARYGRCLVEQFVAGRELTVGILGDSALPPIEIVVAPAHEFYDYQAKYFDDATQYVVEPELGGGCRDELCELALSAHRLLGCRDFSRVDFIVDRAGQPFVLEVNTIPGFTTHSLVPKAAAAAGLAFPALCDRLVEMAMTRVAPRDEAKRG